MAKITLVAKLTCVEGENEAFESALAALVAAADSEPGLEVYSVSRAEDNIYWFFEVYSDQAALDAHGKGEKMKAAMAAVGALMAARPEVTTMTPVAAKGLDLG